MKVLIERGGLLRIAALIHRMSGVGLALFLPLHFLVLGLALNGTSQLDGFLSWTDLPVVKLAEGVLIFLLSVHLLGGLRLLAIENLTWRGGQKAVAVTAGIVSAVAAFFFLVGVF